MEKYCNRILLMAALTVVLFGTVRADQIEVRLSFYDSVMVNDTLVTIGNLGIIECTDPDLAFRIASLSAGECAPPGFSRFINADDLLQFRLQPRFANINFSIVGQNRIKVISDFRERRVEEFSTHIESYVEQNIGWKASEYILTIKNPRSSVKCFIGEPAVEISGMNDPFVKGNTNLLLILRQGTRVHRIPVSCNIKVNATVLVASRQIDRGEELNENNCIMRLMDITSFAYKPLQKIPSAGKRFVFRSISQGSIVHDKMLRSIPVVSRGDQVRITFSNSRIRVSVMGVARESGSTGERIWVENLQTGKLVRAEISGKGSVSLHQEGDNI